MFLTTATINSCLSTERQRFRHCIRATRAFPVAPPANTSGSDTIVHRLSIGFGSGKYAVAPNSSNCFGAPGPGNGPGRAGRIIDACAPKLPPTQFVDEPTNPALAPDLGFLRSSRTLSSQTNYYHHYCRGSSSIRVCTVGLVALPDFHSMRCPPRLWRPHAPLDLAASTQPIVEQPNS